MNFYLLFKALHLIAVISWMAGLLYLPRIFVYHANPKITEETSNTFKIMERRLYRYICTPAAYAAWITVLVLTYYIGFEIWLLFTVRVQNNNFCSGVIPKEEFSLKVQSRT